MAIPKDHKSIFTNLPIRQLEVVIQAVEDKKVEWKSETGSMLAELFTEEFVFDKNTYTFTEYWEMVSTIELKSGDPVFIQRLIDEHEVDLAAVVEKRDYDKAKGINSMIESLKKLLPK